MLYRIVKNLMLKVREVSDLRSFRAVFPDVVAGRVACLIWRDFATNMIEVDAVERIVARLDEAVVPSDTGILTPPRTDMDPHVQFQHCAAALPDFAELAPLSTSTLDALADAWHFGLSPKTLWEQPVKAFTLRALHPGGFFAPHIDRRCDFVSQINTPQRRLALNIYLHCASCQGGLLAFWSPVQDEVLSEQIFTQHFSERYLHFDEEPVHVKPRTGDLVLFDSEVPHAVTMLLTGIRATWSSFVGYHGPDSVLEVCCKANARNLKDGPTA